MLSIIVYIIGFFYTILGLYTISLNKRGTINRLFLLMTISLAIWSFSYSVALAAHTAEESIFWRCVTVLGWGIIYSIILHLVLVLGESHLLKRRITLVAIYLPAIINVILYSPFGIFGPKQYKMMQTEFGWVNTFPTTINGYWLFLYYITFGGISILLLFRWLRKIESNIFLKKDVVKFKLSFYFTGFMGIAADILPDILGIKIFPKITIIILFIPTIALFSTLKIFGLFFESKKTATESVTYGRLLMNNRLILFKVLGYIFICGGIISFLIRFFVMRGSLEIEFFLSAILIFMGILAKLIPIVIKNQIEQNTMFLLVSVAGVIFFSWRNFDTGAITVWAISVLFFLLIAILGAKTQSLVFAVISMAIQIIFLITQPEITVTVTHTDYVTRIAIIALAYSITNFLTNLNSARVQKYEKATFEQNTLEKISSSLISFNKDNAEEILNKMFKMSAGILNFDYAYLFETSADYKNTSLVSSYVNCAVTEDSFSHHPGTGIEHALLSTLETLITNQQPIVCDDVSGISIRKHEGARNYFMSKGINSFAALPAILDERVYGVLVVEYRDRADMNTWANRLSILKILTNALADAKKKLLYEERLYESAYIDVTTKMPNMNMLTKTLESVLNNSQKSEGIAILDIEVENLKTINDTFGYAVGEQVILKSASILKDEFEDCIIISRTAGKEFIVVLPYRDNSDDIWNRAEKVIGIFSQPVSTETGIEALFVIINIGISLYPQDGEDVDTLLEAAELAGNEAENSDARIVFLLRK